MLRALIAASMPIVHQGAVGSPSSARSRQSNGRRPEHRAETDDQVIGSRNSSALAISRFAASVTSGKSHAAAVKPDKQRMKRQPIAVYPNASW